jgi:hypothetical protein
MTRKKSAGATPNLLKTVTDKEREFSKRVTAKKYGNLLIVVRENQGFLLPILAERCTSDPLASASRRAVCALGTHAFKLARGVDLLLSQGYTIQSLSLARGMYETVTAATYLRSNPDKAVQWLDGKSGALPKLATVVSGEIEALLDKYANARGYTAVEQAVLEAMKRDVPKVYGLLSKHTHPEFDAVRHQIFVDGSGVTRWMSLWPGSDDEFVTTQYARFALIVVFLFQVVLAILLLVEFREDHLMGWEDLAKTWDKIFFGQVQQFQNALAMLEE